MVSPVEWDTLSIAEHLEAACDPRKLQLLKMHKQASALNAAFTEHGGLEGIALLEKMQATLAKCFTEAMYPQALQGLVSRRLQEYGAGLEEGHISTMLMAGKSLDPELAWALVITGACSWLTARRFQDSIQQKCLFGCWGRRGEASGVDRFDHYLSCPRLTFVVREAAPGLDGNLAEWMRFPTPCSQKEARRRAGRIAMALHLHRALRLEKGFYQRGVIDVVALSTHLERLRALAASAAAKFRIARFCAFS